MCSVNDLSRPGTGNPIYGVSLSSLLVRSCSRSLKPERKVSGLPGDNENKGWVDARAFRTSETESADFSEVRVRGLL
jgi:hypothetical protein